VPTHDELKARAAAAYNAAADAYDAPGNTFWARFGARTVDRLGLRPGMRVLDVCAGSGASAIPAAQAVGPGGRVVAVDLADNLLARLRAKAERLGLPQLEARPGDLLDLDLPESAFDAVICVFGIFFVADMAEGIRQLRARVRPGGQLAITTWGPRVFEPANSAFWNAVRAERVDLYKGFNPWDTITAPDSLRALFESAGVADVEIVAEPGVQPLDTPDAAWSLVMGSGYRGTVEQLAPDARARVEARYLQDVAARGIREIEPNVVSAVARGCAGAPRPVAGCQAAAGWFDITAGGR
jgi:ubiquinone/menaquinone biosynthesis C-methylase UbiE